MKEKKTLFKPKTKLKCYKCLLRKRRGQSGFYFEYSGIYFSHYRQKPGDLIDNRFSDKRLANISYEPLNCTGRYYLDGKLFLMLKKGYKLQ